MIVIRCVLRAAWYRVYEYLRLRYERWKNEPFLFAPWDEDYPLISVYIPTFNRVDLLMSRALPSVLKQSYENIEVIVAAHGCTDDTVKAVKSLFDRRVRVIEVPRTKTYPPTAENHWFAGPVVPANAALDECKGEWIARVDDDDMWTLDHLELLFCKARKEGVEFISGVHTTNGGEVVPYKYGRKYIGGTQTWMYRSYLRFMKYNPDCWRKKWNRVNDIDLQTRFVNAGVRIGYLSRVIAYVLPRPNEKVVGLKAYIDDRSEKERHYAFTEHNPQQQH